MNSDRPLVGVAIIIAKNNKVLLHKRKNSHGDGAWAFPGGHLEFMETIEECAKRETKEEMNLNIKNLKTVTLTNDFFPEENKHYITIFVTAKIKSGKLKLMEPEKSSEIGWFSWDELPEPLFIPLVNLLDQGYSPFEG